MSVRLLKASLRNYRRILILSVGIILAVSLIAGINIGIETISRGVLQSYIQNVSYDMSVVQQTTNASYTDLSPQIASIQDIVHVEKVIAWTPYSQRNLSSTSANLENTQFALIGLDPSFQSKYNVTMTQGTWNLTAGVVIPTMLATSLKIKPGDLMNISLGYPNSTGFGTNYWVWPVNVAGIANFSTLAMNMMFGVSGNLIGPGVVVVSSTFVGSSQTELPLALSYATLLTAKQAFETKASQGQPYQYSSSLQVLYRIFLNRDRVLNLFDTGGTLARLTDLQNQILFKVSGFSSPGPSGYVYVDTPLTNAINSYRAWQQGGLLTFYFYSLPVLPITWYLAMTSWYMVNSRRRREFGLLKARGISGKRIFRAAILEAVVIGVIGSLLGLLAGYLVGAAVADFVGSQALFAFSFSALTPEIVGIGLLLGTFISVLAALRPARMAARLQATEAVKEYVGEEVEVGKPWRPTWTWIAVILGTYKMLEWIFGFSPFSIFPFGPPSDNFFVFILVLAWGVLSGILIPIGPFLFVYGITKLITRSQSRLYRSTTLVLRGFMKDLANVTARALSRNPARVSRVAFLIALTLTFGILVNVSMASGQDLQTRIIRLQLGADVRVLSYSNQVNESFASNLTAISGVRDVTTIYSTSAYTQYSGVYNVNLYGINASNFLNVAYTDEQITVGAPQPIFQKMQQTPDAALVSVGLADFLKLKVGDNMDLLSNPGNLTATRFEVAGFYKALPGVGTSLISSPPSPGGPQLSFNGGAVIANLPYLRKAGLTNSFDFTFLLKPTSSANADQVAGTIRSLYGAGLVNVETFNSRMQDINGSAPVIASFRFLELTSGYLLVAAVIGFAIISWANTQERLGEIAIFRSRGTSRGQALKILFAESFAVLMIALIIGVATGLVSAYGLTRFFSSPTGGSSGLDPRLVAPTELWYLLGASIAGFLLSIIIPSWLSLRKTVIETVRFR